MQTYEITFISIDEKGAEAVEKILKDAEAEILDKQELGQKKLAYPIKKQQNGFYSSYFVKVATDKVAQIEKKINLQKLILRVLIVKKHQASSQTPVLLTQEKTATSPEKTEAKEKVVTEPAVETTEKAKETPEDVIEETKEEVVEEKKEVKPAKAAKPAKSENKEAEKKKETDKKEEEKERLKKLEEKLDELLKD